MFDPTSLLLASALAIAGAIRAAPSKVPGLLSAEPLGGCEPGSFPGHWISGGPDCGTEPVLQVQAYNEDLLILRESLCVHYEAPFMYLIFGEQKALLLDTGSALTFNLYEQVARLVDEWKVAHGVSALELLVTHSHNHGDHTSGDPQFIGQPNTTLVLPGVASNVQFFGFTNWPNDIVSYDLGNRVLDLIPIPGHEDSSIAFYDRRTCLLLPGDSLYPGRLYVVGAQSLGQWDVFKASIQRLVDFTATNPVSSILGCHIEMTRRPGIDYPFFVTWHPHEHELQLDLGHLDLLNDTLIAAGDQIQKYTLRDFIIYPIN